MIVYGDPQMDYNYHDALDSIRHRLSTIDQTGLGLNIDIDQVRTLLIHIGQLEQAVSDAERASPVWVRNCRLATDVAAAWFCSLYADTQGAHASLSDRSALCDALAALARFPDAPLRIKIPEGFEFYALFPEQYIAATQKFLSDANHRNRNIVSPSGTGTPRFLILGIRSLGTTLSAIVKAALTANGCFGERLTVRPSGPPFHRRIRFDDMDTIDATIWDGAIVVDEGPGLSGSSMAAAATELMELGCRPDRIAFFPGHGGLPGPSASPEVLELWASVRRYFVPLEDLRWAGCNLQETLAKTIDVKPRLVDISAGAWRRFAFACESDWPAASIPFERMKFLATTGDDRPMLWKFCGFGSLGSAAPESLDGYSPKPIACRLGFVCSDWIEGQRLTARHGAGADVLSFLSDYLLAQIRRATPVHCDHDTAAEQGKGVARLREIVYHNVREQLGEETAARACAIFTTALADLAELPTTGLYADGRMGPWEFVRDRSGRIWKTDSGGHDADHTIVGKQSWLWDFAGLCVEWQLTRSCRAELLARFRDSGSPINPNWVLGFEIAYAAFRMGQTAMSAMSLGLGSPECSRLHAANDRYAAALCNLATSEIEVVAAVEQS